MLTPLNFSGNWDAPQRKSIYVLRVVCTLAPEGARTAKIDPRYAGHEEWQRACNAMAIRSKFRIFLSS